MDPGFPEEEANLILQIFQKTPIKIAKFGSWEVALSGDASQICQRKWTINTMLNLKRLSARNQNLQN